MGTPRKVVFMIPTMSGGGSEKVMLEILQHLDRTAFDPYLVVFQKKGAFLDRLPPLVPVHSLVDRYYFFCRWVIYFRYKKFISILRPDVVVSFMWYPNFIVLLERWFSRGKQKVIISERNTLAFTNKGGLTGNIRKLIVQLLYPTADYVIALTRQMKRELLETSPIELHKIKVIHNPVDIYGLERSSKEPIDVTCFDPSLPLILSIGSLTRQKGFKYLISAFAHVIEECPAHLVILGEGKDRRRLQSLIEHLGIREWVHLPGFEKNPYKYMAHATTFALSSIYEGFPNALIEAMALGVPCIATRCPTGPEEIITDGVDGLLVSPAEENSLAETITRMLQDVELQKRLSEAGKKRVKDFRVEKIVRQYQDLIMTVMNPRMMSEEG